MIVKKINTNIKGKGRHRQMIDLIDYIRFPHNKNPEEKILHAGGVNFITETHQGQKWEMITLACQSIHSNNPITHWVFSWPEDEIPTHAHVDELVQVFMREMGLEGHQAIYGLHGNTKFMHVHLAINRMNEITGKVVRPNGGFDIRAAHKALAVIEDLQGWKPQANSLYKVVDGEVVQQKAPKVLKPTQRALTVEQHTGVKSAVRIAQEEAHPIISSAKSWLELHTKLEKLGMRFTKKGSGAIIEVGDIAVKASSVDRAFALGKMEKRLGEFEPYEYKEQTHPRLPEPVSEVNIEEWQVYQKEVGKHDNTAIRAKERARLQAQWQQLNRETNAKYAKVGKLISQHGMFMGAIARHCIRQEYRAKKRQIWSDHRKGRMKLPTRPTFQNWLQQRGQDAKADLWRYRRRIDQLMKKPKPLRTPPVEICPELDIFTQYADAIQAQRFHVTSIKKQPDGTKKAFRLDKQNGNTEGFTADEVKSYLATMRRMNDNGEDIFLTPISDEYNYIVVNDLSWASYHQIQEDGFRPTIYARTASNNFQCVIAIPKLGSSFDRAVADKLTAHLNEKYGDPSLSRANTPHRALGFQNRTPWHRRQDGQSRQKTEGADNSIKLQATFKRTCQKAAELAQEFLKEMEEADRKEQESVLKKAPDLKTDSPEQAYYAHFADIRKLYAGQTINFSRVDSMIATRMRLTGHSQESVQQAIEMCAPTIRYDAAGARSQRWSSYAKRIINYAFGAAGDLAMLQNEGHREKWMRLEETPKTEDAPQQYQAQRLRMR